MTYCRCHCRRCGSHFSSLEGFDHHHQGSGATLVPCAFPEDAPLVEIIGGTCAIDGPDRPEIGVTVYTTERSLEAAQRLSRLRGRESERPRLSEAVLR